MPRAESADEALRAFIAVEVDPAVVKQAAGIIERLRTAGGDIKWVAPENLHLTLKFLGPTRRSDLPALSTAIGAIATQCAPFELELIGVGAFPNLRRPNVIWLGVAAGQGALAELAASIEAACTLLGWATEARPYRSHLTLGRSRTRDRSRRGGSVGAQSPASSTDRADLSQALEALQDTAAGISPVDRMVLMQSELRRGGPIYTVIDSFTLTGSTTEPEHR